METDNLKYLVVPDVHHRIEKAEELVRQHPDRIAVFLGDYFDDFEDSPAAAERTARWLAWSVRQPRRIHLMGNHDAAYRWSGLTHCPGWTEQKHRRVSAVMHAGLWDLCKIHHVVAGVRPIVLSHAGFTLSNLFNVQNSEDLKPGGRLEFLREISAQEILSLIDEEAQLCLSKASCNARHHFFQYGSRMGCRLPGGPWWLDMHQFVPIPGIDQIVGHTIVRQPKELHLPNKKCTRTTNWFIDTNSKHAALIDDGVVSIIKLPKP